jgi:4-hydroxythreonine-4-phosphate dehydrogenase
VTTAPANGMSAFRSGGNGKPIVGITMGDPAGIGAEVIVKSLADPVLRDLGRFVIFGVEEILADAADAACVKPFWFRVEQGDPLRIDSGVIVRDFSRYSAGYWMVARPTKSGGAASIEFLDAATSGAKSGALHAIVTGPIHKTSWQLAGCRFPGHTEKLADAFDAKRVTMAFIGGGVNVALASAHVGLFELRNRFTIGFVFQPIDLLSQALRDWFGMERPRIAVAGLNPHAGEGGRFGDEERRVIEPAIQMARNAGINVDGPFPPDTMFLPANRERFDGFVCMYHDQGLIPVKLLAFDRSVNVTLGLPVIRTSVDHGTAFDIAGTNQADPGSMTAAIRLACEMASLKSTHPTVDAVTAAYE